MLMRLIEDCDGQDLAEYTLLIAIVALGCVAALGNIQNVIGNMWATISNNLAGGG